MNPFSIPDKMKAFGFHVQASKREMILKRSMQLLTRAKQVENQAVCIVLDTIKGQGVSYFEQDGF